MSEYDAIVKLLDVLLKKKILREDEIAEIEDHFYRGNSEKD